MAIDSHREGFQTLVDTITGPKGELETALRVALFEGRALPADIERFADTVAKNAYKVTDSMVEQLKEAGYSEDQIFEATVVVSVRAAAIRLEANERAIGATR